MSQLFSFSFRRLSVLLILGLALQVGASPVMAQEAEEDLSEVGLNGIIGEPLPPELDTAYLEEKLPESWKAWARSLDEDMITYLTPEELNVKQQRELIQKMQHRVDTMRRAIADVRYLPIRDLLLDLADPLERHLKLSRAILDGLEMDIVPVSAEIRTKAFHQLRDSTNTLAAILAKRPDGAEWNRLLEFPKLQTMLRDQNTPLDELQKHLKEIHEKLAKPDNFTADQLRFLRSNIFWPFHRSAAQIQTILKWEDTPPTKKDVRETLKALSLAVVSLEVNYLVKHTQNMQLAWDKLLLLNPAFEGKLGFLHTEHDSDNVYSTVAEHVVQDLVYERRTETSPISETQNGTQIYGNQQTQTEALLEFVPSPQEALMQVNVAGDIKASTVAVQGCIKVYVQGASQFWANKQTYFDGFRFQPQPAKVAVNATTLPYDADTPISCLPLMGSCLERIVLDQANKQRGETEASARQKVATRVHTELNQEFDARLAETNNDLTNNTYQRLANTNLYPIAMRTATTDSHLLSYSLIRNLSEQGGGPPPVQLDEPSGVNFHIHETLLNNMADRINLAGRIMTDAEVREEVSRFLFELTGRQIDLSKPANASTESQPAAENGKPPEPATNDQQDRFVFDKQTPVRFQIRKNQLQMTIRTGLIRSNGEEIGLHDIMIPWVFELVGDEILLKQKKDETGVALADPEQSGGVLKNLVMGEKISAALEDGRRSRNIEMALQDGKTLTLRTERIKAVNGWLSIWALPINTVSANSGSY